MTIRRSAALIDVQRSVGELATEIPGAARVFEHLGIDFCCGGRHSLSAACEEKGLKLEKVIGALTVGQAQAEPTDEHWRSEPVAALTAYIVERHHQYVRIEVPHIQAWLDKVVAAHGERHPELVRIRHSFTAMAAEMAQHMAKEELILFPAIARMAAGRTGGAGSPTISQPVRMMLLEHDHTGRDLADIREASGDFAVPPDGCGTYRALYQGLAEFESDMHQHVHLENNILFPRALVMETEALQREALDGEAMPSAETQTHPAHAPLTQ